MAFKISESSSVFISVWLTTRKTPRLRITDTLQKNPLVTGGLPSQRPVMRKSVYQIYVLLISVSIHRQDQPRNRTITFLSLLEAPALRHYRGRFYFMQFVRHGGAKSVRLSHDNLRKPTPVKQVVLVTIVILSNICRAWTTCMYLCMDYVKFLSGAPGVSILWGATILWQLTDPFGGASIR